MKIAFNPSTVAALTTPPNNKDITFDLRGHSIFARGVEFKGTDTNTWRDIKINNVSIGSNTLDLRNGSNTTLTNTNGVVTINSTWRPVVDNLTSDSTTSSLSAKQGKVLKALIDGKSNSDHNHDGRYLKLTGGTMLGALNFANNTWNLVGDDSYIGDCNISGHFGIKAANTTYPGITFFNNASTFLGNLTAYSGNIKYGAYSLQFLDNGNTSVSASTWTNPFSNYNSNAVADGQAICVWGQSSYLSNLSTDTGNMSLWLKRINANVAMLNMVLDGEYYANGNQRLAHVSEIPNKDSWNYDDRYLRLTGGWMSGDINFGGDNKIHWGRNSDSASISFKNDGDEDANSYMSFVTSDNGNEYFRWSHSSNSTNTEWMALRSDGLRVRGTKVSLEGHSHNDLYYTKAESNAKYITDIATSVNKLTFTRNGSNIARNITVNVVYSQGQLPNIPNKDATTKANPGLLIYDSYNQTIGTNPYSSVLSINTGGTIQIAGNWGDDWTRNLYWRSQSDRNVANYPWKSWRTILDSENYSSTLDSRYYTESEVNSLLDAKLNRQNLSYSTWNPRGYHLAADYHYNGGDLSISENNGKMYVSVDGCFWQNEGQYRVLDTSDIGNIRDSVALHQYLLDTDTAWYPLVWGGNSHYNTSYSTGPIYKSYDKLSWQTSSQTLYATNIQTNNIKNLSIGGGIYWNSYVESASDGSDAASITLVRSGVAGGTTLVLSQMNDTNDTIQFKTNTAARLYHNSYPILTTQNTYVSNNKGYIYGNEITQVNNSDKLDGEHASSFVRAGHYDSNDLNKLDTYSFIRSVDSNVSSTSPKGNTGWYNVIQLVHRNGTDDGPSYIGQIALGMTTNTNDMFFRGRRTDPWKTVIHSGNYTEFINNYYWANVKISTSSSTTTSPTFSNVYLGNSLYLNHRGSNSIYNGPNDYASGVGGPLNNLVFSSWFGVSFTTSCAGLIYTNKNAVSINCRTGQLYAREVQANGFMHTGHNNNDAVLLAGGGYKTLKDFIFLDKSYNYTDNNHYNLSFRKLSGICNNLVWVDGYVKGYIVKVFAIDPAVLPYRYCDDPSLNTMYIMTGNNFIAINAIGTVIINNATDHEQRVGFFYTGRA